MVILVVLGAINIGFELDRGQPGNEAEQASEADQQDGRRHAVAAAQRRPDQNGAPEHHHDHEAQHVGTVPAAGARRRPWEPRRGILTASGSPSGTLLDACPGTP